MWMRSEMDGLSCENQDRDSSISRDELEEGEIEKSE